MQQLHAYWRMEYIEAPRYPATMKRPFTELPEIGRRQGRPDRPPLETLLPAPEPLPVQSGPPARGPVPRGRGARGAFERRSATDLIGGDPLRQEAPHRRDEARRREHRLQPGLGRGRQHRPPARPHRPPLERRQQLHARPRPDPGPPAVAGCDLGAAGLGRWAASPPIPEPLPCPQRPSISRARGT